MMYKEKCMCLLAQFVELEWCEIHKAMEHELECEGTAEGAAYIYHCLGNIKWLSHHAEHNPGYNAAAQKMPSGPS